MRLKPKFLKLLIFRRCIKCRFHFGIELLYITLILVFTAFIYCTCRTYLDALNELLDIQFNSEVDYDSSVERFIMYRCDALEDTHNCGGLADRLKGIMSVYIWSLLSNRSLLIRITRPCNFDSLLIPNQVNWNRNISFKPVDVSQLYRHGDAHFKYRLEWMNFTQLRQKKRLLIISTNRNFLETIARNKFYESKLRALGFDPNRLNLPYTFGTLYRRLFKLAPHLQKKYDAFVRRAKPTPNTKLICVQVRIGGKFYERILWKDVSFQSTQNAKRYWQIIREKLLPQRNESYRLFLSTDDQKVHESFLKEFSRENVVFNEGPFNHIDLVRINPNSSNCESIEKSILDFHSFQLCDSALITFTQFAVFGMWLRPNPTKDVYAYNTFDDKFFKIDFMEQYGAD